MHSLHPSQLNPLTHALAALIDRGVKRADSTRNSSLNNNKQGFLQLDLGQAPLLRRVFWATCRPGKEDL